MTKRNACLLILWCLMPILAQADVLDYIRPMMGTGGDGRVIPFAAKPFGMVQLAPDTYFQGSGYFYDHKQIRGFSHTHKSGGGCSDFQDIVFMPLSGDAWTDMKEYPQEITMPFSHDNETSKPGYYSVKCPEYGQQVELTATERCGIHRYSFAPGQSTHVSIDLKKGNTDNCTIWAEDNFDTVFNARIEVVDQHTIRGFRLTHGWAPEQHVYFYAKFSKPILNANLYNHRDLMFGARQLESTDVRAIIDFGKDDGTPLIVKVGISPVSMEGAAKNLKREAASKDFDQLQQEATSAWRKALEQFSIEDNKQEQKEIFYTCLYYALLYPQLYSDVDGHYRSSDSKVYRGKFRYFAGVLGLWDTFRAQNPLITILYPDVTRDLMKTFLQHYNHCGQLPIWTLAGVENMCMIGYHAMPVIADAYAKGIRGYDAKALFKAMKTSAERDTFGFFVREYRGAKFYKQYHYAPFDKEISSGAKTLEYCYDDWCIAQMARMLGEEADYKYFMERAGWYRNVFDKSINFMRGRHSDGSWRVPFDPFLSNHWRENDDFCEGNSWQWTFFVPHDGRGLIELFGGKEPFVSKLDSLFLQSSELHGDHPSGDIAGFIGQYAHGNEPSHHTIYMYNYAGTPWKAQKLLSDVCYDLYSTNPDGFCGNDDTGQMSAWYIMTAMGFYPVKHGTAQYFIGTPLFQKLELTHHNGKLTILAPNVSRKNCYIQSVTLNGKPYTHSWLRHEDLFNGNAELKFVMGDIPNKAWGSDDADIPE